MIAVLQDFRNAVPVIFDRPGILRIFQKTVVEGFLFQRIGRYPLFQQSQDTVHQDHGRQFPARQHIVADADLFIDIAFDPMIDPFVMSADDDQFIQRRKTFHVALGERTVPGSCKDRIDVIVGDVIDQGTMDDIHLHQHPRSSAIGSVIDVTVLVPGIVADIDDTDLCQILFQNPFDDGGVQKSFVHLRKQCQHGDLHSRPSILMISIFPFSRSTFSTNTGRNGTRYSFPSSSFRMRMLLWTVPSSISITLPTRIPST